MNRILPVALVVCAVMLLFQAISYGPSNAEKVAEIAYGVERNNEQDKILVDLQALNDPQVSQFVSDWMEYAGMPTAEQLSELRIIQQNIKNDKSVAVKYTVAWKESGNGLCSQIKITGSFDGEFKCKPGL